MKKLISLPVVILFLFAASISNAQTITSFSVIPANPTDLDDIWISLEVQIPFDSCWTVVSDASVSGFNIGASAQFMAGTTLNTCTRTELIHVGKYNPCGSYTVIVN